MRKSEINSDYVGNLKVNEFKVYIIKLGKLFINSVNNLDF